MDLQEDLARGRSTLRTGPVRLEVPLEELLATPLSTTLETLLDRAWFLAPRVASGVDAAGLGRLGPLAEGNELYLDLELPEIPDASAITEVLGRRIARLRLPLGDDVAADVQASAEVARRVSGRVVLVVSVPADGLLQRVKDVLGSVASEDIPSDVHLAPADRTARDGLLTAWDAIREAATTQRVTVTVHRGPRVDAGPPLDPLAGANVLDACVRAVFRTRASLCPFPFVGLFLAGGGMSVCPLPEGPHCDTVPAEPWNAALFTEIRQAFIDGTPPEVCRTCTLLPRVRRSLSDIGSEDDGAGADLPAGSMEV